MNTFDYTLYLDQLVPLLKKIEAAPLHGVRDLAKLSSQHTKPNGDLFAKDELVAAYRKLAGTRGLKAYNEDFLKKIRMRPVRTLSGVAPITVLTKPFPCPGTCIFCPNDVRMPKSYLSDEPGAQRAERNYFDPYLQTTNRLRALYNIGHTVDKAEIIVLGGTWSYYPESYQVWFIKECFRALNEFNPTNQERMIDELSRIEDEYAKMEGKYQQMNRHAMSNDPAANKERSSKFEIEGSKLDKTYNQVVSEMYVAPERIAGFDAYQSAVWPELEIEQKKNETAEVRCVGLVIETRPDNISEAEVIRVRRLGCTKTQIGVQSLQDEVLTKNKRGHDVAATRKAFKLLRQAGFKIHAHWMANLYGSSVAQDKEDYLKLFNDSDFKPDELKIYPCSLIGSAELMQYYQRGEWQPYTYEELLDVLTFALKSTPSYCRLTRVIRDIPSTDIVEGNKKTNFRQIAEQKLAEAGERSQDIRAREIRGTSFAETDLKLEEVKYETSVSREVFFQYMAGDKIVAFLRLSLPKEESFIDELKASAIIREIHVYGQTVGIGQDSAGKPQHLGLGTKLIKRAHEVSSQAGFSKLAVISAIGTREYYRKKGFTDGELYQFVECASVES
ncbi:MAG TPA: tRNA uridine(34) 5-carboxymethylaminomethyl modification radical SAM/GNAT enzyme Elp3 [Patescibacteria group bacterium]